MSQARCGLVLVGAGSGLRMGGVDKAWAELAGRPMFVHSLERFLPAVSALALVVRPERVREAQALIGLGQVTVVAGGASRQESVWSGIQVLPAVDVIAVHDVARPLASLGLLQEGIRLVTEEAYAGAVPVIPVADTIKVVDGLGVVEKTLDRSLLRAAQTPQVFGAATLLEAHARQAVRGLPATDDASLLESSGHRVVTFPGSPENFKVTAPVDLQVAELLLGEAIRA